MAKKKIRKATNEAKNRRITFSGVEEKIKQKAAGELLWDSKKGWTAEGKESDSYKNWRKTQEEKRTKENEASATRRNAQRTQNQRAFQNSSQGGTGRNGTLPVQGTVFNQGQKAFNLQDAAKGKSGYQTNIDPYEPRKSRLMTEELTTGKTGSGGVDGSALDIMDGGWNDFLDRYAIGTKGQAAGSGAGVNGTAEGSGETRDQSGAKYLIRGLSDYNMKNLGNTGKTVEEVARPGNRGVLEYGEDSYAAQSARAQLEDENSYLNQVYRWRTSKPDIEDYTLENANEYDAWIEEGRRLRQFDQGDEAELWSSDKLQREIDAMEQAVAAQKAAAPKSESEARGMKQRADEIQSQQGRYLALANGELEDVRGLSGERFITKRPDNYEDYDEKTAYYDSLIYDFVHGRDGAFQDVLENGTPEEQEAAAAEVDELWARMENGTIRELAEDPTLEEERNRTIDALTQRTTQEQNALEKYRKLLNRQSTVEELERNASGDGAYHPENAPEVSTRMTTEGDMYQAPGGDQADQAYYYINNNWLQEQESITGQEMGEGFKPYWSDARNEYFLTDEERQVFNQYYNSGDKESALAYLDGLNATLNSRRGTYQEFYQREHADGIGGAIEGAATVLAAPITSAVGLVGTGLAALGNEEAADPYSRIWDLGRWQATTRDERGNVWAKAFSDAFGGSEAAGQAGKFLNGIVYSMADNIVSMGLTKGIAGAAGVDMASKAATGIMQFIMSSEATSASMLQGLKDGKGPVEAAVYAVGDGVIEAITEKYSIEALLGTDPKDLLGNWRSIAGYLTKNAVAEGSEEVASDLLGTTFDAVVSVFYDHENEIESRVRELTANGTMSEKDAMDQVLKEYIRDLGTSFLGGAISGLGLSGGNVAMSKAGTVFESYKGGRAAIDAGNLNTMLEAAAQVNGGEAYQKQIGELRAAYEQNGTLSTRQAMTLYKTMRNTNLQMVDEVANQAATDVMHEVINAKIMESGRQASGQQVTEASQAAAELLTGEGNLTRDQKEALKAVPEAMEAVQEVMTEGSETQRTVGERIGEATAPIQRSNESLREAGRRWEASGAAQRAEEKAEVATEEEKRAATGTSTGSATEVIADGEYAEIVRKEGGNYVVRTSEGTEKTVDAANVRATGKATATIMSWGEQSGNAVSDRFVNTALNMSKATEIQDTGRFLDQAMGIRLAAYTGQSLPQTSLRTEVAQALYSTSLQDAQAERATATENQITVRAGEGKATFGGAEYGSEGWNQALDQAGLTKAQKNQAGALAEIYHRIGLNVDFIADAENDAVFGSYNAQTGTTTINLAGTNTNGEQHHAMVTAGHEMTHWLEQNAGEAYDQLRSYVLESMGRKGVNVNQAILNKMENYNAALQKAGESGISIDGAIAEIVADSCDQILGSEEVIAHIQETRPTLYNSIKSFVKNFVARVKSAMGGMNLSSSREARLFLNDTNELAKKWLGAYDQAIAEKVREAQNRESETKQAEKYSMAAEETETENAGETGRTEEDENGQEIITNGDGDPMVYVSEEGTVSASQFSLRTWTNDEIRRVTNVLKKKGYGEQEIREWIDDISSIASIVAADRTRLDFEADTEKTMFKKNAEYIRTLDASTLCAKRLIYQGTFNEVQHLLPNTALLPQDLIDLSNMMREMGYETPCGICYVESRRRQLGKFAEQWLQEYQGEYVPRLDEITTTDGLEKLRVEHRQAYDDFIKGMNKKGVVNPKVVQLRTDYRGEIRKMTKRSVQKVKNIGGLRIQSFSDFEVPHLLDMMQAVLDMHAKGLTAQAYTKVPEFAAVFGDTGIKINLSLIGKGSGLDSNGNLIFDDVEGMPFEKAMELRERYGENVGTILVGMNDRHILAAMADDRIDFIIPFHKSGWSAAELHRMPVLNGYEDYTDYQNEKKIISINPDGSYVTKSLADMKEVNFEPVGANGYWDFKLSGKENAELYLKKCAEAGRIPKFSNFLVDNGDGSFSLQPDGSTDGYWKTLIDFRMYDNNGKAAPQREVTPTANMEEAQKVLAGYTLERNGVTRKNNNDLPVASKVVQRFVEQYKAEHPGQKYSVRSEDAAETEYSQAVENDDMETAQRLVDQAAAQAGYTVKAFHGTARGDRVGNVFLPERATSGPMAFFTDNREIAENYARDKKDTSIEYDEEYGDYYTQFRGTNKKGKNVAIGDLWNEMTMRQRQKVTEAASHITEDDDGEIVYDPSAKNGNGGFDSYRLREHGGNAINALIGVWLEDGTLYGEEGRFLDVLKLAGLENVTWNDPDARHEKVYDTWLKIQNPFSTSENFNEAFLNGMEAWWENQDQEKYSRESNDADMWDKNNWSMEGWLERAREDIENGTSHVWTSIPDFVTDYLKSEGFDGIQDVGGKNGGESHTVWIPFSSEQIKSAEAVTYDDQGNVIPLSERFNETKRDIRYSVRSEGDSDVMTWMDGLSEESLQSEAEKKLLRSYQGLRSQMAESQGKQAQFRTELEEASKALSGENFDTEGRSAAQLRDAVRRATINIETETKRYNRLQQELYRVTSGSGYAGMMYRQNRIMRDFVSGRTQEQVRSTVSAMVEEIGSVQKELTRRGERLENLAQQKDVLAVRSFFSNSGTTELAKQLRDTYKSGMKTQEIGNALADIALKMKAGTDFTAEVNDLAARLISTQKTEAGESYILNELRGTVIRLTPTQMKQLKAEGGSLNEIRSALKGTGIRVQTAGDSTNTLDKNWDSLCDRIPSLNRDAADTDMLGEVLRVVEGEMQTARSAAGMSTEAYREALAETAGDVAGYAALLQEGMAMPKDAGARNQIRQIMRYMMDMATEAEDSAKAIREMEQKLQSLGTTGLKTRAAVSVLERDLTKAVDYYDSLVRQEQANRWNEERQQLVDQLESKAAKELLKEQGKWQKLIETNRRVRELTEEKNKYRSRIGTVVRRLDKLLTGETDQQNIPEDIKPLAREVLRMIVSNDAAGMRKITRADHNQLMETKRLLDIWQEQGDSFDVESIEWSDDDIKERVLDDLAEIEDGILYYNAGTGRDTVQLEGERYGLRRIQEALSDIYTIIQSARSIDLDGRKVLIDEQAFAVEEAMDKSRFKGELLGKGGAKLTAAQRAVVYGNMTPEYFFKNLRNAGMTQLWEEFHRGENQNGLEVQKAKERMAEIAAKYGYGNWDLETRRTLELQSGAKVQMNDEQLMALWATWKREQTVGPEMSMHLTMGGFVVDEGQTEGRLRREQLNQRPRRVTTADMQQVESMLTAEQKGYVDEVVGLLSHEMSELGNEASLRMYGIKKYMERYYFPFTTWDGTKSLRSDQGTGGTTDNRAAHKGWSKRRMDKAKNALSIGNFTETAVRHMTEMINYNTMAVPVENMNRVLNYQLIDGQDELAMPKSVRTMFGEAYGRNALDYLETLQKDINGGVGQRDNRKTLSETMLSVFKKNAVAGSLSVAAQQPLSYIRASMMISPKYLAGALNPAQYRGSYAEMLKYSGVAVIKEMGRFDMNFGQSARDYIQPEAKTSKARQTMDWISDKSTILPELMDRMTWTRMWTACKLEQQAKNQGMDFQSDEFLEKVAERFNEVMRKTQVYDSVLVKSANMRSQKQTMKALTSFMAEPTLTINVLTDAVRNTDEPGGKRKLAMAAVTYLMSAAAQAVVKGVFSAGRSPDDDRTKEENILNKVAYKFIGEANPLSLIPGYSDMIDLIMNGEISDDAMSVIGKFKTITQSMTGILTGQSKKGLYRDLEDSAAQLAQLFTNVPAKNLMRDARAMYNLLANPSAYNTSRATSAAVLKWQVIDTLNTSDMLGAINSQLGDAGYKTTNDAYYDRIYQAQKAGDTAAAEEMSEYLLKAKLKSNNPEQTLRNAINSRAKKDENATAEEKIAILQDNGAANMSSYILEQYAGGQLDRAAAEKMYREQNPDKSEDDIWYAFDREDYKKETGTDPGNGKYYRLYDAIDQNKSEAITGAVKTMTSHGMENKNIKSQITKKYKADYLALKDGSKEKVTMKDALVKAYKAVGLTAGEASELISGWKKDK